VRCAFFVNARSSTLELGFYGDAAAGGYLFPPDQATAALTRALSSSRCFVLADNGAFADIGNVAAAAVADAPKGDRDEVISSVRSGAAVTNSRSQEAAQLSVKPNALIGVEDITLSAWLRAGVDEKRLCARRKEIGRRNRKTASAGAALERRLAPTQVLTVASAHDYDTSRDAGATFAAAGLSACAIGFGAFMADDSWVDEVKILGRIRRLGRRLPMRYIRTALVARGFFDGWRTAGGGNLDRFHFLGLGAPIMLPLAALAAASSENVSFDATSPIRDASEATLYVSKPACLKVRTWKVAEAMARVGGPSWSCPCKFCSGFLADHPFEIAGLRRLRAQGARPFISSDLRENGRLASLTPLFLAGGGSIGREAVSARVGHNHWVLGSVARRVTAYSDDLETFAEGHVHRYEGNAGAVHFAAAVRLAMEIIRPGGLFWLE
jgi:hypothetical protein